MSRQLTEGTEQATVSNYSRLVKKCLPEAPLVFVDDSDVVKPYLYAFRNPKEAYDQEIGYLARNRKKGTYSEEKHLDKQSEFGLIVFESNKTP